VELWRSCTSRSVRNLCSMRRTQLWPSGEGQLSMKDQTNS
jgi:hypothetical protein